MTRKYGTGSAIWNSLFGSQEPDMLTDSASEQFICACLHKTGQDGYPGDRSPSRAP